MAQRKVLFIKKEFQGKIIAIIVGAVFIFANVTLSLMFLFLAGVVGNDSLNSLLGSERLFRVILPAVAVIELTGLLIVGWLSLYVSHHMAGPIYRLEKLAGVIEAGDLSIDVRVRKDDEFQELAAKLDAMVRSLRGKLEDCRDVLLCIESVRANAAKESEDLVSPAARKQMAELFRLIDDLGILFSAIKLGDANPPEPETIVVTDGLKTHVR